MSTEFYNVNDGNGGIGEALQTNWVPLSLIGVGIAWLVAGNTGLAERVAQDERVQAAGRKIGEVAGQLGISGDNKDGGADSERRNGWVHQAAGVARGALSSVRDAGSTVLDRASAASDLANRAGGQVTEKLSTDPWLIGVAGLVAGVLLAAMLPPTRMEQDYIGEARDELWHRANELGHEAAERVRELADPATRTTTH